MLKREIVIPLFVLLLFVVFFIVGLLLFMSPNRKLINARLRIGALILSLTFIASCGPPEVSCYEVASYPQDSTSTDSGAAKPVNTVENQDSIIPVKNPKNPETQADSAVKTDPDPHIIRCYVPPHDDNLDDL